MTAAPVSLTRGPPWQWLAPAAAMAATSAGAWRLVHGRSRLAWASSPRIATRTPGPSTGSLRAARDFTAATLDRWEIGERGDDIVVVVSELLTNAVRHAVPASGWCGQPVRLGLLQPGPYVLCAVADPSGLAPSTREPGRFDENGRGLHVVSALSDEWGWTPPSQRGKVVWAMFVTGQASAGWCAEGGPAGHLGMRRTAGE